MPMPPVESYCLRLQKEPRPETEFCNTEHNDVCGIIQNTQQFRKAVKITYFLWPYKQNINSSLPNAYTAQDCDYGGLQFLHFVIYDCVNATTFCVCNWEYSAAFDMWVIENRKEVWRSIFLFH